MIKLLSVLLVQTRSKLIPLCPFNFRCNSKGRYCSAHSD